MKMRLLSLLAVLALAGHTVMAEDVNLNEKPDTVRVNLSPYSFGPGIGIVSPLNDELSDESPAFLKLSFFQTINFAQGDFLMLGMYAEACENLRMVLQQDPNHENAQRQSAYC